MPDIIHRIGVKAPIATVHAAVSTVAGIAGWWTQDTVKAGDNIDVVFRTPAGDEIGRMTFNIAENVPDQRVRWRLTAGPEEWIGTDVTFDLAQEGDYVVLLFGHRGWREPVEFMSHCSMKWATFLLSLRQWVETGTGLPSPGDLKIDNWN